jgi:hypothetical protein
MKKERIFTLTINNVKIRIVCKKECSLNMALKSKKMERFLPAQNKEKYLSAIREFTQMTIETPDFFKKSPDEQREIAFSYIMKHQKGLKKKQVEK